MNATATTLLLTLLLTAAVQQALGQEVVTLEPDKDNTLYEDDDGAISNGAGPHIYAGVTGPGAGNSIRRALLHFDVADAVPAGSQIERVTLTLNLSQTPPGAGSTTLTLHRVTRDWGEGTSNAGTPGGAGTAATEGDATWIHAFFDDTAWSSPGGDFAPDASASLTVPGRGAQTWGPTDDLAADVQAWLDDPDQNFGWILIGDESTNHTARRFDSRESSNSPELEIQYGTATSTEEIPSATDLALLGAFPNPFTERTTIRYSLDAARPVRFDVYDLLGRRVRTIETATQQSGETEITLEAGELPPGVYVVRMEAGAEVRFRQVVLSR